MKPVYLIDSETYLEELEKGRAIIIKSAPRPKRTETPVEQEKPQSKPLEINPVYRYTKDGDFVDKYINGNQLAKKLGWKASRVNSAADQERPYNGFLLTRTGYTKEQLTERLRIKKKVPREKKSKAVRRPRQRKEKVIKNKVPYIQYHTIYQYNKDGELVASFINASDMANKTGWKHNTVKTYSKKETVYNGFLISHTCYEPPQAKERFREALKGQQMTYVYKDGELVATFSTLSQVKEFINTTETLKRISYHKEKHKPIEGYILSGKKW